MVKTFQNPARALAAAALAAALGLGVPAQADAPVPFVIPGVLPLSGPLAFFGQTITSALKALEVQVNAEGGINGRPVKFDIRDDQSSPQVAVQITQQLVAEKPAVIIGSTIAALCAAQEPLTKNGPVQYCLSPSVHPAYNSYLFSAGFSTREQYNAVMRYFRTRKLTRIATIATTDTTGQDADTEIAAVLKESANASLQLVDIQHFNSSDTSVSAQIAHLRANRPDALIVAASGTQVGTVFHALVDAGLDIPVVASNSNISVPVLTQLASFLPKDLAFAGAPYVAGPGKPSDPNYKQVVAYVDSIKGSKLNNDLFTGLGWDPALILVDAYRKLGTNASAEQVRNYIEGLHHWAGINGIYDFSKSEGVQRGLTSDDVQLVRWVPATHSFAVVATH